MRVQRRDTTRGQNVDSLLDTMANVVGVLVVLMAVTQLTVNDAMKRIRMWESDEAVVLRDAKQEARTRLASVAGIDLSRTLELARLRDHIRTLRTQPAVRTQKDTADLAADVASQRMQVRRLEDSIREKGKKLANLEFLLSQSEARTREEAALVRLPDPRPAPPAADEIKIFCRYGRVFDPRFGQLERELGEVMRTAPAPVTRYFEAYDIGNEMLRWRVLDTATHRVARLEWRQPTIGETLTEVRSPGARFREVLAQNDAGAHFLRFYVWEDSFEVYLEARRLAEEAGFAAGWQPLPAGRPLDFRQGRPPPTPVD